MTKQISESDLKKLTEIDRILFDVIVPDIAKVNKATTVNNAQRKNIKGELEAIYNKHRHPRLAAEYFRLKEATITVSIITKWRIHHLYKLVTKYYRDWDNYCKPLIAELAAIPKNERRPLR